MNVPNRIATGQALLKRSRAVLAPFENGRRVGMTLAGAPGILPAKPLSAVEGDVRPTVVQRHGSK